MTVTDTRLEDLQGRLDAKRHALATVFAEAGPELDLSKVKSVPGGREDVLGFIRATNAELDVLGASLEHLRRPGPPVPAQRGGKSLGQRFVESKAYRQRRAHGGAPEADLAVPAAEVKTLMTTTAGWAPEPLRDGRVQENTQRPIQVLDLIPTTETTQAAVVYMEETTFTNPAAETAEGGTYPEATFVFTEQSSPVRKLPTFLPVTDEQLDDVPQARDVVDTRLGFMLRQRLDGQVLVGNGTPPNLRGVLNVGGIQTQAKGADTTPDAAYKALVKVRVTGRSIGDAWVFHPTDWQGIRLLKDSAGAYVYGPPSLPGPAYFWGLPVAESDAITLGTALVGAWATQTALAVRQDITVQVSNSHGTFFVEGKQAIRADTRVAFVVYRPAGFCTVTGL